MPAEAHNRIGLIDKVRGENFSSPERTDLKTQQYSVARARYALARQIYKQLLARAPNNKIALVRLVLANSNQVFVAERLADDTAMLTQTTITRRAPISRFVMLLSFIC